ncbi:MAG: flippase-like domain-containing protein [Euryarchaeota archaeon]|nr:flippase-like domain-containing protein [Euryarchaeota archaeon]
MRKLNLAVLLAVTLLLLWGAREISWRETLRIAASAEAGYIALAVAVTVARFLMWGAKWHLLVGQIARVSFLRLLVILMAGLFVSPSTPGAQVGGEPLRAYYLAREAGVKKSAAMATVMLDKAGNYTAFFTFSAVSAVMLWPLLNVPGMLKMAGELLLLLLLLAAISSAFLKSGASQARVLRFVYHLPFLRFLRRRFSSYAAFEEFLSSRVELFLTTLREISTRRGVLAVNLLLSFAMWSTSYLKTYLVFKALGVEASLLLVTVVKTIAILAGMASFLPGGVGATEAVMVALFAATGIEGSAALAGILLSRAIYYSFALGAGYLCLLWLRLGYSR